MDSPLNVEESEMEQEHVKDGKVKIFSRNYDQALKRLNDSPIHNLLERHLLKQNASN